MSRVDELHDDLVSRHVPVALLLAVVRIGDLIRSLPVEDPHAEREDLPSPSELDEVLLGLLALDNIVRSLPGAAEESRPADLIGPSQADERWLR